MQSISFERALLASILQNPNIFGEIVNELDSSDFSYEHNGAVFATMSELHKNDLPLDSNYIISRCGKKDKDLENFKNNLFEIVATSAIVDIGGYITEIKNLSLKRKLHSLAINIQAKSKEGSADSFEIIDSIEKEVFNLQNKSDRSDFRNAPSVVGTTLTQMQANKDAGNQIQGLKSGFRILDETTNGFKKGELIVIAARPGMGKTAFALNAILPTLRNNEAVAFVSLEMGAEQLMLRLFAIEASIPLQRLISAQMDNNEWQYLSTISTKIANSWRLYIEDGANLNISALKSKIRRLMLKEPKLSLVVIDYLQIMSGISNKDRHLEIAEISRGLKNLARELGISIIALSQLNRMLESRDDKRPMLSDLRESGAIEQDADIVLFLYRGQIYDIREQKKRFEDAKKSGKEFKETLIVEGESEEVELIIGKHRNGELKTIKIIMHPKYTRFVDKDTRVEIEQAPTKMIEGDGEMEIDMPL